MHFELDTFDSRALPVMADLNGVSCEILGGGLLADPVDVPQLPGLVADGYAVLHLLGIRGDAVSEEVIYSMSGFYRGNETGTFEMLGSPWTGAPRASGTVQAETLRLRVSRHPKVFRDGVEMTFRQNAGGEITPIWQATVAESWPSNDSRDAGDDTSAAHRRLLRAWRSPLLRRRRA